MCGLAYTPYIIAKIGNWIVHDTINFDHLKINVREGYTEAQDDQETNSEVFIII
jgi:hypothetical protein